MVLAEKKSIPIVSKISSLTMKTNILSFMKPDCCYSYLSGYNQFDLNWSGINYRVEIESYW